MPPFAMAPRVLGNLRGNFLVSRLYRRDVLTKVAADYALHTSGEGLLPPPSESGSYGVATMAVFDQPDWVVSVNAWTR
jgi:hypothetical protein